MTVLGELVYPQGEGAWTVALLEVLRGMGVEDHAARQAIARTAAAGWIEGDRVGRAVRWDLTGSGRGLLEDGMRRSAAFVEEPEPWDGQWLVLLVTVPQEQRPVRRKLYGGLAWLGMGNPSPGVWVTPHVDVAPELRSLVRDLELTTSAYAFVGSTHDVGLSDDDIVRLAWDLSDLERNYQFLIERFSTLAPAEGDELLFAHLELLNDLQRFIRLDPRLPKELLPEWVGREAAALIRDLRAAWSPLARARWREIAEGYS